MFVNAPHQRKLVDKYVLILIFIVRLKQLWRGSCRPFDISALRSVLMEKSWPDQRSIGRHIDDLFDLVIRDCHDIDEAMVFFQD
ncbi:hypothetical protein ANCDUO_06346 [Ancylostoma duodenale]|uniref:Uncharacterized protein n=1 Tax=Ancylostoma duodenale TaxID=51022 RepID=A0A0C2GPW2_9BILA|nr:hypothetical protein ANCDUO_06346 [Ancylostoma duodenale]